MRRFKAFLRAGATEMFVMTFVAAAIVVSLFYKADEDGDVDDCLRRNRALEDQRDIRMSQRRQRFLAARQMLARVLH